MCYGDSGVEVRVLSNWSRVERFSHKDVHFLKDFSSQLQDATRQVTAAPAAPLPSVWASHDLLRMARSWSNSIQLTDFRASLLPPAELLESVYSDFVDEAVRQASNARGRSEAKFELGTAIRKALSLRLTERKSVRSLMQRNRIEGLAETHPFDAIVGNGAPVFVAHALSFETDSTTPSEDLLRSLAFRIEDVRKLQPKLPFAIFALPPDATVKSSHANDRFERASTILNSVDVPVLPENEFDAWLNPLATVAALHLGAP